jgi:hypothetical protein
LLLSAFEELRGVGNLGEEDRWLGVGDLGEEDPWSGVGNLRDKGKETLGLTGLLGLSLCHESLNGAIEMLSYLERRSCLLLRNNFWAATYRS